MRVLKAIFSVLTIVFGSLGLINIVSTDITLPLMFVFMGLTFLTSAKECCDTRNVIQNSTKDIIEGQNAGTRAILDFLTQDKIASLQAENQSLKFQASQTAQNAYITASQDAQTAELIRRLGVDCPQPAYVVQPPQPVTFPNYNSCGCGCA